MVGATRRGCQGGDQPDDGLQAKFQFGQQHCLDILTEGFEPATRLDPGGGIIDAALAEHGAVVSITLQEALAEQDRDIAQQRALAGSQQRVKGGVELSQLPTGH